MGRFKGLAFLFILSTWILSSCGGGGGGSAGGNSGNSGSSSASVTVTFPNLFSEGGKQVFPTYISHIIDSSTYPLAYISVQNTGPTATTMEVSVDLPYYGSPATQTITLAAGASQTVTLSPVLNISSLFGLTTEVPGSINISVTSGSASLYQNSTPVTISGRDTVFWTNSNWPNPDTSFLIAAMVTPDDKAGQITTLLSNAKSGFPGDYLPGYQASNMATASWTLSPGEYHWESFYVLQGESPTVTIDSIVDSFGYSNSNFYVGITDEANFNAWKNGSTTTTWCVGAQPTYPGSVVTCPTPITGRYYILYNNPPSNISNLNVTRDRPMLHSEVTYYQAQAIFYQLRAKGLSYANLPGTGFLSSSQNVMYPSESLSANSANCIEGSLVFASAFERLGMSPLILLDHAHGHAYVGVRMWTGVNNWWGIESTMVGGSSTFHDAINTAYTNSTAWITDNTLETIDVELERTKGMTPAPM